MGDLVTLLKGWAGGLGMGVSRRAELKMQCNGVWIWGMGCVEIAVKRVNYAGAPPTEQVLGGNLGLNIDSWMFNYLSR